MKQTVIAEAFIMLYTPFGKSLQAPLYDVLLVVADILRYLIIAYRCKGKFYAPIDVVSIQNALPHGMDSNNLVLRVALPIDLICFHALYHLTKSNAD